MEYGVKMVKKPTAVAAWSLSLAAGLDLCAFVFIAAISSTGGLLLCLLLLGGCELGLILLAIRAWKMYFEGLIDYRVRQLEGAENDMQAPGVQDG